MEFGTSTPVGVLVAEYRAALQTAVTAALGAGIADRLVLLQAGSQGDFPYNWQNPANGTFNYATYSFLSQRLQQGSYPGVVAMQGAGSLPQSYLQLVNQIDFVPSPSDAPVPHDRGRWVPYQIAANLQAAAFAFSGAAMPCTDPLWGTRYWVPGWRVVESMAEIEAGLAGSQSLTISISAESDPPGTTSLITVLFTGYCVVHVQPQRWSPAAPPPPATSPTQGWWLPEMVREAYANYAAGASAPAGYTFTTPPAFNLGMLPRGTFGALETLLVASSRTVTITTSSGAPAALSFRRATHAATARAVLRALFGPPASPVPFGERQAFVIAIVPSFPGSGAL